MDRRIEAILAKLASDSSDAHTPERLVSSVNLSASRLRHLFKEEVGMPLGDFVRISRMKQACALLDATFLSIKQVAYELGLNDETHLIREFKKAWGTTPNAYRQRSASAGGQPEKPINSHIGRWFFLAFAVPSA